MQTEGICWIRLIINTLLLSQTCWQVPVQPALTNFCLQRIHGFHRPIPWHLIVHMFMYLWLLLAGNPLFLPQIEEEDDSHSMLEVFFQNWGWPISFNLQLSLDLGSIYLWDIPAASLTSAPQLSFSPSLGAVRIGAYKIPGGASPSVRREKE